LKKHPIDILNKIKEVF